MLWQMWHVPKSSFLGQVKAKAVFVAERPPGAAIQTSKEGLVLVRCMSDWSEGCNWSAPSVHGEPIALLPASFGVRGEMVQGLHSCQFQTQAWE
ncbi:unnamed protein product [Leuciscus chuanchicus]